MKSPLNIVAFYHLLTKCVLPFRKWYIQLYANHVQGVMDFSKSHLGDSSYCHNDVLDNSL